MKDKPLTFVGYASDLNIRYASSSGGITTAIIKYLFDCKLINTVLGCTFNVNKCCYELKLIYSYNEYELTGSVYQDLDVIGFIRRNIKSIKGNILIICAPCQVKPIKYILNKNRIKSIIIDYFCSGQTTLEGTYCYYNFLGIKKTDVLNIRYRGNGWPNGIEIKLKNGKLIKKNNYTEPWSTLHRSGLFRPKRCHFCKLSESTDADISVGDPWLEQYKNDDVGHTLFLVHTKEGLNIIEDMKSKSIAMVKEVDYSFFTTSQKPNIEKKRKVNTNINGIKICLALMTNQMYRTWATKNIHNMKFHIKILRYIIKFSNMTAKELLKFVLNKQKMGWIKKWYWKNRLAGLGHNWKKGKNVTIHHPECICFGNNVGIGKYTYFLPCKEYAGIKYNPKISIGDGTWIGIRNSFAAIHGITIGKNVLFAGYVHITDHSHGYEDIEIPISKQPLVSKGPVVIEDDCWLGFNCEILSGVHIGRHSIVAAHSVVTKNVPAFSIVAGNPAKVIKQFNLNTKKWEKVNKNM